ncbi:pseudouridine synthase, partial [Ramicandelaber brevisporus]
IVYQDDGVLVVDKPSGLSTQRDGTNKKEKDIVGMLAAFADESDQVPRLVHRLDKGTSGLLMLAKTRRVAQQLGEMFRDGEINKTYHAVLQQIEGKESSIKWKEGSAGVISVPLNDSTSKRTRVAKEGDELAKSAQTMVRFMAVSESKDRALVELKPLTGRKHQLRVHCVHSLGGVIVGDDLY